MKLSPRAYRILWDAHAWVGVAASLLLHVMFFMGAFALFYPELDRWAESAGAPPGRAELARGGPAAPRPKLQALLEQLARERPLSGAERVAFSVGPSGLRADVAQAGERRRYRYLPASAELEKVDEEAESQLGSFLYSMHFLGPLPYGVWIAGLCSMALLLTLVTGVIIHLKDWARQWFRFRPERAARSWASDLHKVLGVFGLPYQLLYAWTGAVLCLGYLVVQPLLVEAVFDGREQALAAARGEASLELEPSGRLAPALPDVDALVRAAERRWPTLQVTWVGLEHVGDQASTLRIHGDLTETAFASAELVLRASDGALLAASGAGEASAPQRFEAWFYGLHHAHFDSYVLKLLYALLAFGTCAVILSGNLIWLERRDPSRARRGHRVLERLSAGVGAGVVPATACAFVANRLPAPAVASRCTWEQGVFWGAWALALGLSLRAPQAPRRACGGSLVLGGVAFLALPVLELALGPSTFADPVSRGVLSGLSALGAASLVAGSRVWRARAPGPIKWAARMRSGA